MNEHDPKEHIKDSILSDDDPHGGSEPTDESAYQEGYEDGYKDGFGDGINNHEPNTADFSGVTRNTGDVDGYSESSDDP